VIAQVDPREIVAPTVDWLAVGPEIALAGAAIVIVLLRSTMRRAPWVYRAALVVAIAGTVVAGVVLARQWNVTRDDGAIDTVAGMVRIDGFGVFLGAVVVVATLLTLLLAGAYVVRERLEGP